MNTAPEILSIIIAAISGGIITQFINAKKANIETKKIQHDIEKKIANYHKDEVEYLISQVQKYKEENQKLKDRINIIEEEIKQLKHSPAQPLRKKKKSTIISENLS